tara:strand:+ start:10179 stop:10781 length:603 start_codon:yes stop_codon:yes gene_type:complete
MVTLSSTGTFDKILLDGIRQGQVPARTRAAQTWYRNKAKSQKTDPSALIREDKARLRSRAAVGNMYFFFYDAKHKKTLPYFDRFPVIFPIKRLSDGYLGMNFHYLPLKQRAVLMNALYSTTTNDKFDESTKLKVSYDILNGAAKYKWFKPTIHRYLSKQLKSRFLYVHPSEWDIALWLPVAQWSGASQSRVWKDSRAKMK